MAAHVRLSPYAHRAHHDALQRLLDRKGDDLVAAAAAYRAAFAKLRSSARWIGRC